MPPPADAPEPPADSLFAAWLARHEADEQADFEAACWQHPQAAAELRDLRRACTDTNS